MIILLTIFYLIIIAHLEAINPEAIREVSKEQIKSTYQSDYTGIPQGKAYYCSVLIKKSDWLLAR